MPSEDEPGLVVRPAHLSDLDAVTAVFTTARAAAVPSMPPPVHDEAETRAWLAEKLAGDAGDHGDVVWVAEQDGAVVGMLLLEGDFLHSVYVDPRHQRQGVGTTLVEVAKSLRHDGLRLWVFQSNEGARRLYERLGFVEVRRTEGAANDEHEPDVHLHWPDRMPDLRRRIDELDARLAALLDERAAVTATIQRHKAVPGHAGRDAAREADIAARMAACAPHLGERRIARIMDVVITESLDAAGEADPPTQTDPPT